MEEEKLNVAMFSIHSCPVGELGTKDTGGMNVYIRELAGELGNRGHRVDIYTRVHDPNDPQVIHLNENARVIHLRAGKNGYMHKVAIYPYLDDFTGTLENFILRENLHYDLIHSHYWLSGQVGRWAQARWNVPHMLMFHTLGAVKNTTGVGKEEPLLRITTERQIVQNCHRIIAATEREKSELMRFYGAESEKMNVVPCGVNMEVFQPVDKGSARRQLGFSDDEKIVLYVGRFAALKGIDRLLKAMTHLRHHKGLKLVIIGGDGHGAPEFEALQRLSSELGINDMISFIGRIEQGDLPPYYSAADLLA
ncbi:MAG: glycosyltransferase, partial [Desulfobacterales bacterium]